MGQIEFLHHSPAISCLNVAKLINEVAVSIQFVTIEVVTWRQAFLTRMVVS